jgi:hypothetical protein
MFSFCTHFSLGVQVHFFYTSGMRSTPPSSRSPDSLSVKVGSWFEANATGKGVLVIPIVVLVVVLAAAVKFWLHA